VGDKTVRDCTRGDEKRSARSGESWSRSGRTDIQGDLALEQRHNALNVLDGQVSLADSKSDGRGEEGEFVGSLRETRKGTDVVRRPAQECRYRVYASSVVSIQDERAPNGEGTAHFAVGGVRSG
jgi:hypothetical protein